MGVQVHYEIRVDALDPESNAQSSFLHRAMSGNADRVDQSARVEFERVKRAMQGSDEENLYADHYQTVYLLKGDTPNQVEIDRYTRGA